ncbi:MAG: Hsp20 family protein [Rhodocyclaceae bacterium]|nr:Hsp20 family protein [Rhodocyclaceae bacterium]MBL0075591.1 Hsp20 family protein [Rhodocyclaceae bacterium]MBP6108659.1 Hsp20 family protein [Rhodocyclaceae bacterium]
MRHYDLSPLYRSAIGFDRLANLVDNALRTDAQPSYPPYNVERLDENNYQITMAVAGFSRAEIDIEVENDTLKIVGSKQKVEPAKTYLHRGIGTRDFEHRFQLAEHVKVVSAALDNGLLSISLAREIPETMKPRKISIAGDQAEQWLERKAA